VSLSRDFEELFAFLSAHRVKALIAGAYAVAFYARPRFTKDLDLFVEPSPQNASRLLAALAAAGRPQDHLDLAALREPDAD
jgi:hypothetical protein